VYKYNWNIGSIIIKSQKIEGWGSKFIQRLSKDLKAEFPEMKGFSERNLKYMKKLAEEYEDIQFVQQVVAQIAWSHNVVIMDRIKNLDERVWYINKTVENGWSRNVLVHQIETKLYERQKLTSKTTNYNSILVSPTSELAIETLKDPYIF
jgi:predicted nuclease of restriction endonuclease-like (RecB) superfamily